MADDVNADFGLGFLMLAGKPSFHPGVWPDFGLCLSCSQYKSRPPASHLSVSANLRTKLLVLLRVIGEDGLCGGGNIKPVERGRQ